MTEEENNHLAEKITEADIERLWNSDFTVMEPRQDAIGTLCEVGCLYGWWYMRRKLNDICQKAFDEGKSCQEMAMDILDELKRIGEKKNFFHYFDIRTNHLNEKDWRRSFSINQLLYGMVLACSKDGKMYNSFDEVMPQLIQLYDPTIKLEREINQMEIQMKNGGNILIFNKLLSNYEKAVEYYSAVGDNKYEDYNKRIQELLKNDKFIKFVQ